MIRDLAIVVGLLLLLLGIAAVARGEDGPTTNLGETSSRLVVEDATVLALARVCWSERDAHVTSNDCAAIASVTRRRAALTGRTILQQLRAYSPEATGAQPTSRPRQRWIRTMTLDGAEPSGWGAMNVERVRRGLRPLRWEAVRPLWLRTVAEARALVREPRETCAEPVDHWGGSMDAAPAHWVRVDCGPCLNRFYRVGPRSVSVRLARGD